MKKKIYFFAGWILLAMGMTGIILPILPTTPFVLLAALCFGKSSPKYYQWLCNTKLFGEYIENYNTNKGVSNTTKIKSIFWLWLMMMIAILTNQSLLITSLLIIVAILVTSHILSLKSKCKSEIVK